MDNTSLVEIKPQELDQFNNSYDGLIEFVQKKLKKNTDYGMIPGTNKLSLYKAGAEKISFLFNLKPEIELISQVEDFEKGFFFYKYRCTLIHFGTGKPVGSAIRSCNSKEKKYIKQIESYKDYSVVNTIDAMAQKRAIVACTVQATMATEIFDTGDSDDERNVSPNNQSSEDTSPRWLRANKTLYAVGSDRGFTPDDLNLRIKKMMKVESTKDLSVNDIESLTEMLTTKYRIVEKGQAPQKIEIETNEVKTKTDPDLAIPTEMPENIDNHISAEKITMDSTVTLDNITKIGDVTNEPVKIYCYNKTKHGEDKVDVLPELSYFCSEECEVQCKKEQDDKYAEKRRTSRK